MGFVKVAKTGDVKPGEGKVVNANGVDVALFNEGGKFYAIENTCPHKGGPLGEGMLENSVVSCPWHGWKYDIKTGESPAMPTIKVKSFEVRVEGEDVSVNV